jgi:PCO_ADO
VWGKTLDLGAGACVSLEFAFVHTRMSHFEDSFFRSRLCQPLAHCYSVSVRPIHDDIEPPSHDPGAVRYLHLSEMEGQYSMGIFVFPPHARIPLHDHPGMCVLSRVLYGDVHRLQLDLDRDQPNVHTQQQQPQPQSAIETSPLSVAKDDIGHQHNQHSQFSVGSSIGNFFRGRITPPDGGSTSKQSSSSSSSSPLPNYEGSTGSQTRQRISPPPPSQQRHTIPPAPGAKRAYRRKVDHLRAPQTTILYPYEGNLHEFVAGPNGAAVLDVLLPPYDVHHHRDCTFYEIYDDDDDEEEDDDGDAMMMMSSERDRPHEHSDGRVPCWIVPTGQPEDFHCISGRYRNLGTD